MTWLAAALVVGLIALLRIVVQLRDRVRRLERQPVPLAMEVAAAEAAPSTAAPPGGVLLWMRHEIRTPINAILGMTDLLLDGDLTKKQREYLGMLRASAESLSRTFDDVLDLCRMDAGRVVLEPQPFDLRGAIEIALDRITSMAAERGLDLTSHIAEGTPATVHGDQVRLRQILTTLLTGAVRRTHAGEISVSVSAVSLPGERHELHFVVRDTGIAIPAVRAERLFQPLARIVASGARVADAQDLGLALCHGLAQLMGGGLALRSEPGGGSTFELTIVAESPARLLQPAGPVRPAPVLAPPTRSLRVLLAEDSAVGRTVAVGVLERLGHAVDVVGDGLEVLDALEREAYDVILMDMHMPNMDGLTATRHVCERWSREQRPRIIALSASELPEDRARWLAAGADGWVSKSLPVEDIRRVLAGATGSRPGPARLPMRQSPRDPAAAAAHEPADAAGHVMEVFLLEAASQLSTLREAVARRDTGAIERVAHTLKGSAAMLGATSVARSCADLMHRARHGSLDEGAAIVSDLELHVAAIQRTLAPHAYDGPSKASPGTSE